MPTHEWTGDDPGAMYPPLVIAPLTFWAELERRTGGFEATVPFLAWWVRKSPSQYVKVTGHLIEVETVGRPPADR